MRRLDAYVLKQFIAVFFFFCLVMTGVIWLAKAVPLIDTVIASGQSMLIFFKLSMLVLPQVLAIVVPLACLAAAVYVINKLYTEAELVVMMASGQSPFALARPALIFGALVAGLTWMITMVFAPYSEVQLSEGEAQIKSELANALIVERQFLHPAKGLTLFIRETSNTGQMAGLFLHDQRDPTQIVTYSAARAVLLRDGDIARLVMNDGLALSYAVDDQILSRVQFDEFIYDLSELVAQNVATTKRPGSYGLFELLNPTDEMKLNKRYSAATFISFGHERIVLGLNALLMPLIVISILLTGGYQRRGFTKRIAVAICFGFALAASGITARSLVGGNAHYWPGFYLAPLITLAICLWLLNRASNARAAPKVAA